MNLVHSRKKLELKKGLCQKIVFRWIWVMNTQNPNQVGFG